MSKRVVSISLFAVIGLMLGAKVSLHVTDLSMQASTALSTDATQPITQFLAQPVAQTAIQSPELTPIRTVQISASDSLAMLEAYLIPEAAAEAAPAKSALPFEDATLTSLRQYRDSLDQRSQTLDKRSESLQQAEDQLQRRITELEQLEASIQQRLKDEQSIKNKKIKRLTAVYEGMKAERAAPVIARMELLTVVKIFSLMDEKKVGKILSFLPADQAVRISQALTRQISTVK